MSCCSASMSDRRAAAARAALAALLLLWGLVAAPAGARPDAPTILISIDGFHPDYLRRGVTPNLARLAATGATGPMRPSFPTKTFPNHWTLVTGMRPDRHGIVANKMEDPARPGETFTMASDDPFWWNAAPPIWVTAEKAGLRTATMFWPGSAVAWGGTKSADWPPRYPGGTRPRDWLPFSMDVSDLQRVTMVLDWLRRPDAIRPDFVALYFDRVDTAGHGWGPDSPRLNPALSEIDQLIGILIRGLADRPVNLVITSDHGMAASSSDRVIALDRLLDPADFRTIDAGAFATIVPNPGRAAAVEAALLRPHDHMQCWRKADIPARFAYGRHPRVAPYFCLAETGWLVLPTRPAAARSGGDHGYDHDAPEMTALFIANGPAIRAGVTLPAFDNVAVQPLLAALLGVTAGETDGSLAPLAPALRTPGE
jgi:predicted AlkP superfamily pyrophosphatase or phosphodiesterase